MKIKITLLFSFVCLSFYAQQKSTGNLILSSNMAVNLTLDNSNSMATLALSGPNDRWFALQFGSFSSGMAPGSDVVYWNGSILVDARHNGINIAPTTDPINNWILVSNMNDTPSVGLRTLVYNRPFNTGDSNDYTFNYNNTTIDLAWARMETPSFTLAYHGGSNRGVLLNRSLNELGNVDFSLNATQIYPNPSKGNFKVITNTILEKINIYSQIGAFVKSVDVDNISNEVEVNVFGLQAGIYLLELQNQKEKVWKKVIIN